MTKALAYLRTSSATNVGGDTDKRQRAAIEAYAVGHGIEIAGEYYDADVSGTDAVERRPGFRDMVARIMGNGVRLVLVEDASRFARDVVVQELGLRMLRELGVRVVTASGIDLTDDASPEASFIRRVLGAASQAEKERLVLKMRAARDRNATARGYRTDHRPAGAGPYKAVHDAIRELVANDPTLSLQAIADALTARGLVAKVGRGEDRRPGKPFATANISRFIKAMGLERIDGRSKAARRLAR